MKLERQNNLLFFSAKKILMRCCPMSIFFTIYVPLPNQGRGIKGVR
jgi:hypothetical protein